MPRGSGEQPYWEWSPTRSAFGNTNHRTSLLQVSERSYRAALTMFTCRLMVAVARFGAPPVRGKGAGSHPFEGTASFDPFFRPVSADIRRYGRKVVHEPHAHSRFLSRNAQERGQALAESAARRRCGGAAPPRRGYPSCTGQSRLAGRAIGHRARTRSTRMG